MAGLIVGTGEIFGGGVATALAGHLAKTHGIASALTLAMVGLTLGVIVGIFLKETAPRRKQVSEPAGAPV